jgi:hypothetical protein
MKVFRVFCVVPYFFGLFVEDLVGLGERFQLVALDDYTVSIC